jgi:hypothetical protein
LVRPARRDTAWGGPFRPAFPFAPKGATIDPPVRELTRSDDLIEPDRQFIGRRMNEIQAEMRTIRSENALLHQTITNAVVTLSAVFNDRIAAFEARMETRLDQSERSVEGRLTRIEALLTK